MRSQGLITGGGVNCRDGTSGSRRETILRSWAVLPTKERGKSPQFNDLAPQRGRSLPLERSGRLGSRQLLLSLLLRMRWGWGDRTAWTRLQTLTGLNPTPKRIRAKAGLLSLVPRSRTAPFQIRNFQVRGQLPWPTKFWTRLCKETPPP